MKSQDELVLLPLGGAGEIGMNFNAYGFGPPDARKWIVVDCGVLFGRETDTPGVDVIMPDIQFLAERAEDVLAIVLTHNLWTADWRVLITIFGWLNVVGGAIRLAEPPFLVKTGRAMLKQPWFTTVAAAIWVVLGLLFCFFGYLH